jgi:membrane fusion protein, multidrug efflux system
MNTMRREEPKPKKPPAHGIRVAIIVVLSVAMTVWFGKWIVYRIRNVTTDAAFVKADIVDLSPLVPGHLKVILVDEGIAVQAGQILAALDDRDYQQAFDRANAAFKRAELNYERATKLHTTRTIADAKFEEAEASYREAKASLEQARLNVEHTLIKAPVAGIVAKRYIEPGAFTSPGLPVLALYDPNTLHVIANLEESKVGGVHLEAGVELFFDASNAVLRGKVLRIGEATAAEFALIPRDVSAGEFTKVVQRVPIKISLPPREKYPFLRPGLSVSIGIHKS